MASTRPCEWLTAGELLHILGDIHPERLRLRPAPGTATERDLLDIHRRERRLYELVNGVLVEKVGGCSEALLTPWLVFLLYRHVKVHELGILAGPSGGVRLAPGVVRLPDLSFVYWDRLPDRMVPAEPILGLAPDLAVEVLSPGNTKGEMALKVREYFLAGVGLVWLVDGDKRTVRVYTAPDQSVRLTEAQTLDGGDVLPGLRLPLREVFARTPNAQPRKRRKKE
jgi:Uma2 family endonuclease